MMRWTWRNFASEYASSSEPVRAPSVQAREILLELADLCVHRRVRLEHDEATGVVVDVDQRPVDLVNALLDVLALAAQLGLEARHLPDRVLVEQLLEPSLEPRQIIAAESLEHLGVLAGSCHVRVGLAGVERVGVTVGLHGLDDLFGEAFDLVVLRVDAPLHSVAHVLLAVVARLDRERMRSQGLADDDLEPLASSFECAARLGNYLRAVAVESRGGLELFACLAHCGVGLTERRVEARYVSVDCGELCVQRRQQVGLCLESGAFAVQIVDLRCQRPPVHLAKSVDCAEQAEVPDAVHERALLLLERREAVGEPLDPRLEVVRLLFEDSDLGVVRPAEHVTRAIVDPVAVVLLVPLASALGLTRPRDGARFPTQLFQRLAAGVVEAAGELRLEPAPEL